MITHQNSTLTKVVALFIALFIVFSSHEASAQTTDSETGRITGKVVDAQTGETIIGANVVITGTSQGDATDIDGTYILRGIEPGIYSITISYISYSQKTVTGVEVNAGEITRLNATLQPESVEMGEVTVTAEASTSSEAGMLSMQRKSVPMQDGLSSEFISKTGDGDVGSAIKRVTGVTVRDGKNVYVRGLGNRYGNIQLDGTQIPSTDPNTKEVPTDLLGTGLIESIVVQKTYTADQFAEFSGGSVQIETKQFPYERNLTISYSTSYKTVSTFKDTYTSPGSTTDFLGYDNGKRSLPDILNNSRAGEQNAAQVVQSLHNDWEINQSKKSLPSQSVTLSYANQFNEDNMPIGVVGNFSYNFSRDLEPNKEERFIQFFNSDGSPNFITDFDKDEGLETAELSGMLNLYLKPSSVTKVGLKTLYSNSTTDTKTIVQGPYQNGITRQTVLDFDRRNIFSTKLEAETHFKNFASSTLSGKLSYIRALRIRPDRRTTRYNQVGDIYRFQSFGDNNGHFFSEQDDNNYTGEFKFELNPLGYLTVTTGGTVIQKDRNFKARRISYRDQVLPFLSGVEGLREAPAGLILNDENIANGILELTETTQFDNDWYNGEQGIYAGFISTKWDLWDRFSFEIGGRIEQSTQVINVPENAGGQLGGAYEEVSRVDSINFLPAVNATYEISERTNLRAAFSKTLARPEFREISEFNFADYLGGQRVYGNPDLKQTDITNYDLRFETYPNGSGGSAEMFAVSLFYKQFENPIEKFYRLTDANEVFFDNALDAELYGAEIEARKNITDRLQIVANASYIYSESRMAESSANRVANLERPMVGQSPFIINASAFYLMPKWNMDFSLSYNTFGERIVTVGKGLQDADEYEQPLHELGAKLDYSLGGANLSFEVGNILNDARKYTMGNAQTFYFEPGMTFKAGVSMAL